MCGGDLPPPAPACVNPQSSTVVVTRSLGNATMLSASAWPVQAGHVTAASGPQLTVEVASTQVQLEE